MTEIHLGCGRRLQSRWDRLNVARGKVYSPCLIGAALEVLLPGGPTQIEIEVRECSPVQDQWRFVHGHGRQ